MPGAASGTGDIVVNETDILCVFKQIASNQTVNKIFLGSDEWLEGNKVG